MSKAYGGGMGGRPGYGACGGRCMPMPAPNRPDGKKGVERLSQETGGGY
jgi:hypothetical protein